MKCAFCIEDRGCFSKNYCCEVRLVANMPMQHRHACYERLRAAQGDDALVRFKADVVAEYQRKKGLGAL
jgi:hypothetical protein